MERPACQPHLARVIALLAISATPGAVLAQSAASEFGRSNVWEFILHPQYLDSFNVDFEDGSSAEVNEDWGFGFGMNYNFSQRLALGFDFSWSDANFNGTRVVSENGQLDELDINGEFQSTSIAFNASYYLTDGKLAPFVTGILGWTFIDTNIPSGPPQNACWWDPWYGYICGTYTPSKTAEEFGYGVGAGLRWDVNQRFFLRGSVQEYWFDPNNATDSLNTTTARIDFGFSL